MAAGLVTRQTLRSRYLKLHQNVYIPIGFKLTARDRAEAAWLWSKRRAVLTGYSAAAVLGSRWLPDDAPAELGGIHRPAPPGIVIHTGAIADDELTRVGSMRCTTVARTAYDMGRRLPFETAVIRIDALLNATHGTIKSVIELAEKYPGARGIRQLRTALDFADSGAESPQETRLRLLLVRSDLPGPIVTQIAVVDRWGRERRVDMGWPQWKVGVEYDGEHHWSNPRQYADDIERLEFLAEQGWIIVRVSAKRLRYQRAEIVARVRKALRRAGCPI